MILLATSDLPDSGGIVWPDLALAFLAIILEGTPFLLLGAIVSGLMEVFLPADLVRRWLPRSKTQGVFAALGAGILFPICECGAMPIVQRLIRKGVPPAVATTYLLAAPALNPLALASTYLAFRNQDPWLIVSLRFGFSAAVLIFLGLWLARLRPEEMIRAETISRGNVPTNPETSFQPRPGSGGLSQFINAVVRDFLNVLFFFIIGAAVAAVFSVGLNRHLLEPIGQNPVFGPLAGIALAELLCLCSTTDAFIIAAFTPFSTAAKIAFLVAGPLIDLKLYWLYRSTYTPSFVHRLWARTLGATFFLTLIYALKG